MSKKNVFYLTVTVISTLILSCSSKTEKEKGWIVMGNIGQWFATTVLSVRNGTWRFFYSINIYLGQHSLF